MNFEDDDRRFGERLTDALEEWDEAIEKSDPETGETYVEVKLDGAETAAMRDYFLADYLLEGEDVNERWPATFALISLYESIDDSIEDIESEAAEFRKEMKEKMDFEDLSDEEKQEAGNLLSDYEERFINGMIAGDLFLEVIGFYVLVGSLLEELTKQTIVEEAVPEDLQQEEASERFARRMNQQSRTEFLKFSGHFGPDFTSRMSQVWDTRCKLIHDLKAQQVLSPLEDLQGELNRSVKVLNRLHRGVEGFPISGEVE